MVLNIPVLVVEVVGIAVVAVGGGDGAAVAVAAAAIQKRTCVVYKRGHQGTHTGTEHEGSGVGKSSVAASSSTARGRDGLSTRNKVWCGASSDRA